MASANKSKTCLLLIFHTLLVSDIFQQIHFDRLYVPWKWRNKLEINFFKCNKRHQNKSMCYYNKHMQVE